jgi:hypothetical protein
MTGCEYQWILLAKSRRGRGQGEGSRGNPIHEWRGLIEDVVFLALRVWKYIFVVLHP